MSSQRHLGPITKLSLIVFSVAVATAYYSISIKKTDNGPYTKKKRDATKVSVQDGLREVLADGDPRKPERPVLDIVAVHGLGSKYPSTWMKDNTMWLQDFLQDDFPQARILAFVYPSEPFDDPDFVDLRGLGGSLLRSLVMDWKNMDTKRKRPIIFIGHSFGGLVIKKALTLSQSSNSFVEGHHGYIAEATQGVLFLGTPHFGSQYAFGGLLWARLLGIFGGTYKGLLRTLQLLSSELQHLNQDFLAIRAIRKLPQRSLVCFYETKGLLFGPVVEEQSACLSIATRVSLEANHKDMNKFSVREGPYNEVKYYLEAIYDLVVDLEFANDYIFIVKMDTQDFKLLDCHPIDLWSKQKGEMRLSMSGSGTSGTLVFKEQNGIEKFAVTLGIHNFAPWADIATHFGDETPQSIRDSFYGGKRDVWAACNGKREIAKTLPVKRSVILSFDQVMDKKRFPTEVLVRGDNNSG